jgi:hypothetical protein
VANKDKQIPAAQSGNRVKRLPQAILQHVAVQ